MKKINLKKDYNKILVEIAGFIFVTQDNYENGDIKTVNEWDIGSIYLELKTLNKKAFKEIKKAVFNKLNEELYKKLSMRYFNRCVCGDVIDNRVCWSQFTNDDNTGEPTKKDYSEFKRGLKDLFVQNINIAVKINGEDVSEDDLYTILNIK